MITRLDKPVKTYLMAAIKTALQSISVLLSDQVKYGQGIPVDQDTAKYPWTCFFDETESNALENRIENCSFDLVIQTWVKKTSTATIDDQMDLVDAEIKRTIPNDKDVVYYSKLIIKERSDKMVIDDEQTGILQAVYRVTYAHAWKDPYQLYRMA